MKVDGLLGSSFAEVAARARDLEATGYDGGFTSETSHDALLPLPLAIEATERMEIGTGIAVAFARTPMTMAVMANDLQVQSQGRFVLGLGSQIKAHIERRYSMTWSSPAARMREFVLAMRAIWTSWHDGTKLDFDGEYYTHTLMTPFFDPGPSEYGQPRVFLAGVGERMTQVAGEVADGMIVHPFTTERYVREVTLPAIERGLSRVARSRARFEVSGPVFVATGTNAQEIEAATRATRQQIAFYGSTPAYRPVLALHGWGELGDELTAMSKRGEWVAMGEQISDEILETFAVVAAPDEVATRLLARYGGLLDRVSLTLPPGTDRDVARATVASLRGTRA